jgi:hypothetical protein
MGVGVSVTVHLFLEIRAHHGRWKDFFLSPFLSESQSTVNGDGNTQNPLSVEQSTSNKLESIAKL